MRELTTGLPSDVGCIVFTCCLVILKNHNSGNKPSDFNVFACDVKIYFGDNMCVFSRVGMNALINSSC